jgi:hypothetical protein
MPQVNSYRFSNKRQFDLLRTLAMRRPSVKVVGDEATPPAFRDLSFGYLDFPQ